MQLCKLLHLHRQNVQHLKSLHAHITPVINFLIFRVSSISYNNINIDSTSKIAESEGHEHVIQDFVHSLLTQQIFEGLVYQI